MPPLRTVATSIGWLSAGTLILQGLALQDIYHGEADVWLEWSVVRIAYLLSAVFHALALRALLRQ